jgi:hypothetical protein
MASPTSKDELFEELLRIGDPYLALPSYIAAGGEALRGRLERLLLASARLRLAFSALAFTPASFLARLIVDGTPGVFLRVARNPGSDGPTLDRIYAKTREKPILLALASNCNAPTELLGNLAMVGDADIRSAIIRNPNTSGTTLNELVVGAPDQELAMIARHANAGSELLLRIYAKSIPAASAEVVAHRNCSRDLLAVSCLSVDSAIRGRCAGNPALTPAQHLQLLQDPDGAVRAEALRRMLEFAPGELLETADCASQVRRVHARRPNLSESLAERLAFDVDPWVRRWLARNPSAPRRIVAKLSADRDEGVRRAAGRNPSCPPDQLAVLARDEDAWVRAAVASRQDLSRDALQALESDSSIDVLSSVARNSATRPVALLCLSEHADAGVRRAVILNDNAPSSVLRALLDDDYPLNRALLAGHPNLPLEDAWILAEDPEPQVRFAVGKRAAAALSASISGARCGAAAAPSPVI